MIRKFIIFLLISGSVFLISCSNKTEKISQFNKGVDLIRRQYVPDPSLNKLSASLINQAGQWTLQGESTVAAAHRGIIALADSMLGKGNYTDKFVELPDPALGDSNYALVIVSVAQIREEPENAAQLLDQSIMGRTLRLLKKHRGWYLIQTDYGYIGWMGSESFQIRDAAGIDRWKKADKMRVTGLFPLIYSKPDESSQPITDVVLNALLRIEEIHPAWIKVSTPDGRAGYIRSTQVKKDQPENQSRTETTKNIIATARSMMGFPYLWGGNSSKQNDCSGFTQTVFKANGIDLPRDARQQALVGQEIIADSTFSNVWPGDLLFFGFNDRITHVGISLGGEEFIHQSGMVQVNSLDIKADNFSPYRKKSYRIVKRVF
jgi:cell wall-associated NlpC family hydrolase